MSATVRPADPSKNFPAFGEPQFFLDLTQAMPGDFPAKFHGTQSIIAHATSAGYLLDDLPEGLVSATAQYELRAFDLDGDGNADEIAGTAPAKYEWSNGGDTLSPYPANVVLTGLIDTTSPTLSFPTASIDAIGGALFSVSEPLADPVSLSLIGTSIVPLIWDAQSLALGCAITLPYGGAWTVDGSATDLSGNPLVLTGTLKTIPDPGIFQQDGFEGPLVATFEPGKAKLVSHYGTVSAISGAQSLWIDPGAGVSLHVQNAGGSTLVFSARAFSNQRYIPAIRFDVGVIGDSGNLGTTAPEPSATDDIDTGDSSLPYATPVQTVRVLIATQAKDIVIGFEALVVQGLNQGAPGYPGPDEQGLMIDDLHVE